MVPNIKGAVHDSELYRWFVVILIDCFLLKILHKEGGNDRVNWTSHRYSVCLFVESSASQEVTPWKGGSKKLDYIVWSGEQDLGEQGYAIKADQVIFRQVESLT